jgi:NAD(P)-dependent dehydrogenase (short-subunit alcohol dehydrogenase family)
VTETPSAGLLDFSLAGKVAIVTGGASGIGAAVVEAYVIKGATVVILDRALEAAQRAVAEGKAAAAIACDVTDAESVADAINAVIANFPSIDILVNSAGVAVLGPAEDLALDAWELTISVNLRGAFLMSQHAGRVMLRQGHGTIISIASQAATVALANHVAYCASKFGLVGMTKVLARVGRTRRHGQHNQSHRGADRARSNCMGQPRGRDAEDPDPYRPVRPARGDRRRGRVPGQRRSHHDQRRRPARRRRLHRPLVPPGLGTS